MERAIPERPIKAIDVQEMEVQKIANRTSQFATIEIPKDAEIRYRSHGATALPNGHYFLPPSSYIEISKPKSRSLSLFSPIEGFTTSLKISFWLGILLAAPIWIFLVTQFIKPGLRPFEKKRILPILLTSFTLIGLGILTAYCFTLPLTNAYFAAFNQSLGVNVWSLSNYVDYVLTIMLGHGIAFAAASILFLAVFFDWISPETLAGYRRHAIIAVLILAAILTPPDVLSQLLLAIPMLLLFEGALLYGRLSRKKSMIPYKEKNAL